jgi:hypothetical protein
LVIQRVAVADATPQELGPVRHLGDRVGGFREQSPEAGVMPAQIMTSAVAMLSNRLSEPHDLVEKLVPREGLKVSVSRAHPPSLAG